ncbi:PTS sugar transporter subunit IIB, partial [Staphylococcus epidermidis]|uniref:hypothetical protein n=1 Tax=Staphylococcus epidermidis TaxID=1282 RepID=UPI0011A58E30
MGEEKLEQGGKDMGVDIKVESEGGVGGEKVVSCKEMKEGDGMMIGGAREVDLSRFNGKGVMNES